jgi:hypothetical protein
MDCTFKWSYSQPACRYKIPELKPGPYPEVRDSCEIFSATPTIIPPSPPRTEASPVSCFAIPNTDLSEGQDWKEEVSDSNGCAGCDGFGGYPDGWPPSSKEDMRKKYGGGGGDPEFKAEREVKGEEFTYTVKWDVSVKCKPEYGDSSKKENESYETQMTENWIMEIGRTTVKGSTTVECNERKGQKPPPKPIPYDDRFPNRGLNPG